MPPQPTNEASTLSTPPAAPSSGDLCWLPAEGGRHSKSQESPPASDRAARQQLPGEEAASRLPLAEEEKALARFTADTMLL